MNPRRRALHAAALALSCALGCFTGDGLVGQPCRRDQDCNAIAGVPGTHISCQDGVCGTACGDDVIQKPFEQCEDGNDDDTDDCVNCQNATCGDQATQAGVEECDDGNAIDTDACARCKNAACGDGFVWVGVEECDDDNDVRTDGCVDCRLVACGDGKLDPDTEACHGGNREPGDGCNAVCAMGAEKLARGNAASHACAIGQGALQCWGANDYGQLGYGNTNIVGDEPSDLPPANVPLDAPVRDVFVGVDHTCVVLETPGDNAHCWGTVSAKFGVPSYFDVDVVQLGDEPGELPGARLKTGGNVAQLTNSCMLLTDGVVRCWSPIPKGFPADLPPIPLPGPAIQIESGESETCVVLESGELWCFYGAVVYKVFGSRKVSQVALGDYYKCARFVEDDVLCWGANDYGQLGDPTLEKLEYPDPQTVGAVPLGEPAVDIAAGLAHTCAVLASGGVKCWGSGLHGELGHPVDEILDPAAFAPIALGGPARAVIVALDRTCALLHGGEVDCWGSNASGALGVGHSEDVGDDAMEMPPQPTRLYANL